MRVTILVVLVLSILCCAMYSTSAQSPFRRMKSGHCQRLTRRPFREEEEDSLEEVVPKLRQLRNFIREGEEEEEVNRPRRRRVQRRRGGQRRGGQRRRGQRRRGQRRRGQRRRGQKKRTCTKRPKRTRAQKRLAKKLLSRLRNSIRSLIRRLTVIGSDLREQKLDTLNAFITKLRKLHKKARRPKYAFYKLLEQLFEEIPPAEEVGEDVRQVIEDTLGNVEDIAKRVTPILSSRFFYLPYSIRNASRGLSLMIKNLRRRSNRYPNSKGLVKATSKRLRAMITDLKKPVLEQHFFRVRELLKKLPKQIRNRFIRTFTKRYTHALSAREDLTRLQRKDFRQYVIYLRNRVREFIRTLKGKKHSKDEPKIVKQVTQHLARMRSVFARNNNSYGKLMRRALIAAKGIKNSKFAGYVRRSLLELRDKVKRLRRFFKPKKPLPKLVRQARKGLRHLSARLVRRFPEEEGVKIIAQVIRQVRDLAKKKNQFKKIKSLFGKLRAVLKDNAKMLGRKTIDQFKDFYYQLEEHFNGTKSRKTTGRKLSARRRPARSSEDGEKPQRRRRSGRRPTRRQKVEEDQ